MYDAREKAIRDQQWALKASYRDGETKGKIEGKNEGKKEGRIEGEKKGKIEMIRTLQGILQIPVSDERVLQTMSLSELETMTSGLQEKLRNRMTS